MIVHFAPAHCARATAHPSQVRYQPMLDDPSNFRELWPDTYSALDGDELVAIGGLVPTDDGQGGWVLFTDKITPARFAMVHRAVVRGMVMNNSIFVHLDPDNPQATRWAGLLGLETRRIEALPDGRRMFRAES